MREWSARLSARFPSLPLRGRVRSLGFRPVPRPEIREDLAHVERYAGLEAGKVREALPYLKALGIRTSLDAEGILTAEIPGGLVRFRGRRVPALPGPQRRVPALPGPQRT